MPSHSIVWLPLLSVCPPGLSQKVWRPHRPPPWFCGFTIQSGCRVVFVPGFWVKESGIVWRATCSLGILAGQNTVYVSVYLDEWYSVFIHACDLFYEAFTKPIALKDVEEICMRYFVEGLLEVQGQDAQRCACHFCMRYWLLYCCYCLKNGIPWHRTVLTNI